MIAPPHPRRLGPAAARQIPAPPPSTIGVGQPRFRPPRARRPGDPIHLVAQAVAVAGRAAHVLVCALARGLGGVPVTSAHTTLGAVTARVCRDGEQVSVSRTTLIGAQTGEGLCRLRLLRDGRVGVYLNSLALVRGRELLPGTVTRVRDGRGMRIRTYIRIDEAEQTARAILMMRDEGLMGGAGVMRR